MKKRIRKCELCGNVIKKGDSVLYVMGFIVCLDCINTSIKIF